MNRKGFTLIELLVTISILAVVALISFVSINSVMEKNRRDNCKAIVSNIKGAAKEYASDNRYNSTFVNGISGQKKTITAKVLIDNNYLTGPIIDPMDNKTTLNAANISVVINFNNDYTVSSVDVSGLTCD